MSLPNNDTTLQWKYLNMRQKFHDVLSISAFSGNLLDFPETLLLFPYFFSFVSFVCLCDCSWITCLMLKNLTWRAGKKCPLIIPLMRHPNILSLLHGACRNLANSNSAAWTLMHLLIHNKKMSCVITNLCCWWNACQQFELDIDYVSTAMRCKVIWWWNHGWSRKIFTSLHWSKEHSKTSWMVFLFVMFTMSFLT